MQLVDFDGLPEQNHASISSMENGALLPDECSLHIDTAIVSTELNHRLLTIISTENYQRIVDPASAILSLARATTVHCAHNSVRIHSTDPHIRYEDLDTIFGTWDIVPDSDETDETKLILATYVLDEHLKFNVVLCLCLLGCVVIDSDSCLECAVSALQRIRNPAISRIVRRPGRSLGGRALARQ